mgnify:CR=1 FL=1|nr:DUF1294 domain-containing protein [uncultured Tyzzerella sp.]
MLIFIDKQKAIKHKWRIKESTLFTWFILGGFIGGFLSMKIFHHKTKKLKFYFIGIISVLLHLSLFFIFIK